MYTCPETKLWVDLTDPDNMCGKEMYEIITKVGTIANLGTGLFELTYIYIPIFFYTFQLPEGIGNLIIDCTEKNTFQFPEVLGDA